MVVQAGPVQVAPVVQVPTVGQVAPEVVVVRGTGTSSGDSLVDLGKLMIRLDLLVDCA